MSASGGEVAGAAAMGAGPGVITSLLGSFFSSDDQKKAEQALQKAQDQIDSLQLPPDQSKPIIIQQLKSAGVWKPEMEKAIDVGVSKVSQIQEDPELRAKQEASLAGLQQIANTGMTATGRAEFNTERVKAQQDAEAKRQQIIQSMQQRGMGGAGAELAAQLSAAQNGANEEASAADRIAAEQEQAKMSALGQLGSAAGQVRGQDFSTNQAKAGAADAFKMFDVQNQLAQQARNVGSTNQAAQYDVMNNQSLNNANAQAANSELLRQRQGQQQNFMNQVGLAQLKANAALGQAKQYGQQAQNTAQGWSDIGQGIDQTIMSGAQMAATGGATGGGSASQFPNIASAMKPKKPSLSTAPEGQELDLTQYR